MKPRWCLFLLLFWIFGPPGWTVFAASGQAAQICGKWDTATVGGGNYTIQNNIWGAETAQCISPLNDTGFSVDVSEHYNTGGMPAAYPSIFRGCHWEDCTPNSGMPILASRVDDAVFSWQFQPISSGTWNAVAEAWFKTNGQPGAPDGTACRSRTSSARTDSRAPGRLPTAVRRTHPVRPARASTPTARIWP